MKHSSFICFFLFCMNTTLAFRHHYIENQDHLEICRDKTFEASSSLNYLGPSLTTSFKNDSTDLILCPGDTFGDLNETYITLQDCYLAMYHQGKHIWSSGGFKSDEVGLCAVSLEKDGNLMLFKEVEICADPFGCFPMILSYWASGTNFNPKTVELRIQDKQLQIVHTFQDGTQRVFYTAENVRGFKEDLGPPRQVAEKFLIKNHTDASNGVILRRNEYIGDLNSMYLILQTDCDLQLNNASLIIWSFAAYLKPDDGCTLNIQGGNSIGISKIPGSDYHYDAMEILPSNDFIVLQSNITFQGDQLLIMQTLKNGSEFIFHSEPSKPSELREDVGLKLKRNGRQIAQKKMIISSEIFLRRMDYIGDLDGLHLILRENCVLTLANGQEELWKLQESFDGPFMECDVQFNMDGTIKFHWEKNNNIQSNRFQVFGQADNFYERVGPPSQFQLSLENNMMIITLKYIDNKNAMKTYHAGRNTNGTWFQYLSGHALSVNADGKKDEIFPEMGYIGDINGVFAVLNQKGNWILFNKTKPIWESGTTQEYESGFALILTRDGNVAVSSKWGREKKDFIWSTETAYYYKGAKLSQSELFVNNDGLWLNHVYANSVVKNFKALEGTNTFVALPNNQDGSKRPSFQSDDL